MKRYERFVNFVRILAIFGAIFLIDQLLQKFQSLNLSPFLAVTFRGISAVAVLQLAEFFTSWLFDSCSFIRRLALGDDYLEGVWIDAVPGTELLGVINISYMDGQLRMNGESYDRHGNVTACWDNFLINIDGRTVRTLYRAPQYSHGTPSELMGFSTYIFSGSPGKPPQRYTGYFADSSISYERRGLNGFRITNKSLLKRLSSPAERHHALIEASDAARKHQEAAVGSQERGSG